MVNRGGGGTIKQPRFKPLRQEPPTLRDGEPIIVMVNKNENADEVMHQIQHNNLVVDNNLATMVE